MRVTISVTIYRHDINPELVDKDGINVIFFISLSFNFIEFCSRIVFSLTLGLLSFSFPSCLMMLP